MIKLTEEQNNKVVEDLTRNWNLGPAKASEDPKANPEYWQKMADVWNTTEAQARRQLCANCEYFDNTPETLESVENVPFNALDADGGGRGYCHKFDFICHNLRTCQAWERKDYINVDEEKEEKYSDITESTI